VKILNVQEKRMTDQELRAKIIGKWTCENKWTPHTVEFRPDSTLTIIMSTANFIGGAVGFFSGEKCEGTWAIHEEILRISFDKVPESWLNQNIRAFGISFRLPLGDMITKAYSVGFGIMQLTRVRIIELTDTKLVGGPFRSKDDDTFTWTRILIDTEKPT
jgi:hypothetical protein